MTEILIPTGVNNTFLTSEEEENLYIAAKSGQKYLVPVFIIERFYCIHVLLNLTKGTGGAAHEYSGVCTLITVIVFN